MPSTALHLSPGREAGRRRVPIGVDFDGVAYSLMDAYGLLPGVPRLPSGERVTGRTTPAWSTPIDLAGGDKAKASDRLRRASLRPMLDRLGLIPGFADALRRFQRAGYEPVLLSSKHPDAFRAAVGYLADHGHPLRAFNLYPQQKVAWCVEHGAPVLVDDAPGTIALAGAAGVTPATLRWPYNEEAIRQTDALAADEWTTLARLVLEAAGGRPAAAA
jgi:hypothetical protein